MKAPFSRVFALEVDGRPILAFEAANSQEAQTICKETWLREDLSVLKSGGVPLYTAESKLSVRPATAKEGVIFFGQIADDLEPSEDMVIGYLIEIDS
jgi:hypothetical protein